MPSGDSRCTTATATSDIEHLRHQRWRRRRSQLFHLVCGRHADRHLRGSDDPRPSTSPKSTAPPLPTLTASYSRLRQWRWPVQPASTTLPTLTTTATATSHVVRSRLSHYPQRRVDSDYTISYVAGSLTVTPAALTITARRRFQGLRCGRLPTLAATYSGFVNGDTTASLTTLATLATTATATSHVAGNPYSITPSGAVDADYRDHLWHLAP